uniref:Putative salivary mucin n=2 Tax=Culex tarsalis TaxID=7177 RepID=A0A1Q3F9C6_CULTA
MTKPSLVLIVVIFSSLTVSVDSKIKYKNYKAPLFSDAQSTDDETDESKYYIDDEFPILKGELDLYDPKAPGGLLPQGRPRPPSSKPAQKPPSKPNEPSKKPSRRPKPKPTGSGRKPDKECNPSKPRRRCKVTIVKTENVKIAAPRVTDQGVFPTDAKRSKGTFYDASGKKLDPVNANSRFYVFGVVNRKRLLKEEELDHLEGTSYAFSHDAKVSGLTVEILVTLYTESSLQFDVYSNETKKLTFQTGEDDITSLDLKWYG